MKTIVPIIQLIVAVLLAIFILLQGRGAGLGSSFGGSGELYRSKRGVERIFFIITIALIVFFFLISLTNLLFS